MRWRVRGLLLLATAAAVLLVGPHLAYADEPGGLGPVTFTLSGSRGESLWIYNLSIDRGGITDPQKLFWSYLADMAWSLYLLMIAVDIWVIDWALSFAWVQIIASPLLAIGDAMQQVVTSLGLVPTMLTVAAFVGALLMLSGRWVHGAWELVMSCVIASLAVGVFAQPVRMVAGPDGLLYAARDAGLQFAAAIMDHSTPQPAAAQVTTDQARQRLIAGMVDSLVRMPHQVVNFGRMLDGGPCADAYHQGLIATNGDTDNDDLRRQVTRCDRGIGSYADKPNPQMWISAVLISPAAGFFGLLAVVLAGSIILAGVSAIFQGLKAIITLITGLVPGGGRGSFFMTVADALMSLLVLVFSTVFLALFLSVIQALFRDSTNPPRTFIIVDILLLVGIVIYLRNKKRLQGAARGLAGFMNKRPGGGASRLPDPGNPVNVLGGAARGIQLAADLRRLTSNRNTHRDGDRAKAAPPSGRSERPPDGLVAAPTPVGSAAERPQARRVMNTAADVGLHVAGAVASGGSSTLVTAAAAVAKVRQARQIAATARTAGKALTGAPDEQKKALGTLSRQALVSGARRALPPGPNTSGRPPAPSGGQGISPRPGGDEGRPPTPGAKQLPPAPGGAPSLPPGPRRRGLPRAPREPVPPASDQRNEPRPPRTPPDPQPLAPAPGAIPAPTTPEPRIPGSSTPQSSTPEPRQRSDRRNGRRVQEQGTDPARAAADPAPAAPHQPGPAPSPALGPVAGSSTPARPHHVVRARLRDQVERVVTPNGVVVLVNRST